jgi:hypothetical protein
MKYLKTYEEIDIQKEYEKIKGPQVGDYVIAFNDRYENGSLQGILSQIIGRISEIKFGYYSVEYDPKDFLFQDMIKVNQNEPFGTLVNKEDIKHYSKNKEDLELILKANKYNL